jgi:hypothetical protein
MPESGTPTGVGSPAAEDLKSDETAVRQRRFRLLLDPVRDAVAPLVGVPAKAGHGEQTMTK